MAGRVTQTEPFTASSVVSITTEPDVVPLLTSAPRGSFVSNGTTSGPVVIDSTLLAVKGSIWMTRPAMVHYAAPRAHMLEMARELFDHVLAGRIRGEPNQSFALADAAQAHRALESRQTTGATVLVP